MDFRALVAAPLAAAVVASSATELRMPDGWVTQTNSASYRIGVDPRMDDAGRHSLTVKAAAPSDAQHFGAATQMVHGYAGRRVRFSGQVKAEGVDAWAGLMVGKVYVSMFRSTAGDAEAQAHWPHGAAAASGTGWQPLSVVVELPADDRGVIDVGVLLVGNGEVSARDFRLDVVSTDVPLTARHVGLDPAHAQAQRRKREAELAMQTRPPKNLALE
jgi:hypothetical protein